MDVPEDPKEFRFQVLEYLLLVLAKEVIVVIFVKSFY